MQQSLRIAIVTRSLMMGGTQRHIVKLCRSLRQDDVSLAVFLLMHDEPQDLLPELQHTGAPVLISPFKRRDPRVARWLADSISAMQANVVHSFLWTADAVTSFSKLVLGGPPLVCSERGDRGAGVYYSIARNLYDRLVSFRIAKRFCANSNFGGNLLAREGCAPNKIRVIHNGVDLNHVDSSSPLDLRKTLQWPSACRIVGIVSRLDEYKGVDRLIHALAGIRDRTVRCVIIGDGPQRALLEQLTSDLRMNERIAFMGTQKQVEPIIKGFDVAILATRTDTEHCSNSIMEYMACRRAVIATSVGGNSELIEDGVSGFLVAPNDSAALGRAIEEMISNPTLSHRMGEAGRIRIEQEFNMKDVAGRFASLWYEVASI